MTLAAGGLQSIESLPVHQRDLAYKVLDEANLPEDTIMRFMHYDFGDGVADGLAWGLSRIREIHFEKAYAILHGRKKYEENSGVEALIHDEPEPALPETDGGEDEEEIPENLRESASLVAYRSIEGSTSKTADLRPSWLAPGVGSSDGDIAKAAQEYLAKTALKVFSPAEQQMLIDEGADVVASNLGDLLLEGSHYAELETALKEDDEKGIMDDNELEESSWLI
jgi:hypothetical protein